MRNSPLKDVEAFAGLDVSAREISVARIPRKEGTPTVASFANNASGHKALLAHLLQGVERIRVCLEASGNYTLDLALALHAHRHIEVSLVNPRRARRFAESLGERSKTDPVDARVLCEYAARMPWVVWRPPTARALRLRAITRAIEGLGVMRTQEKNREHALRSSQALPALVIQEMRRHQRYLEHRIEQLRREALRLIAKDSEPRPPLSLDDDDSRRCRSQRSADPRRARRLARELGCAPVGGFQRPRPFTVQLWHVGGKASADQPWRQSPSSSCPLHAGACSLAARASSAEFLRTLS